MDGTWGDLDGGAELAALIAAEDLSALSEDELVSYAAGCERVAAWATARAMAGAAALARRFEAEDARLPAAAALLPGREKAEAELAAALSISHRAAELRMEMALALTGRLPATFAALSAGRIDLPRARAICEEIEDARGIEPGRRHEVERAVLSTANRRTAPQVRRDVRRALLALDPAGAAARHEQSCTGRYVRTSAGPDGVGYLEAVLPADGLQIVDIALSGLADALRDPRGDWSRTAGGSGGARRADQRRADALVGVFTCILDGVPIPRVTTTGPAGAPGRVPAAAPPVGEGWVPPRLPTRQGRRPSLVLTAFAAPAAVIRRGAAGAAGLPPPDQELADAHGTGPAPAGARGSGPPPAGARGSGPPPAGAKGSGPPPAGARGSGPLSAELLDLARLPADLEGYGPVPEPVSRRIAAAAHATVVPVPPEPQRCTHAGAAPGYRPSQAVRDVVVALNRTCRFPGCRRAARQCDLDHLVPWASGGPTCSCNLVPLCRRHHRLKGSGGWTVRVSAGGAVTGTLRWRSPLGRRYVDEVEPARLWRPG